MRQLLNKKVSKVKSDVQGYGCCYYSCDTACFRGCTNACTGGCGSNCTGGCGFSCSNRCVSTSYNC